jgi:hydroxyacylglutathione hydrolase
MKTWTTKNGYSISQVLSGRVNSFILSNGNKNILVDTGRYNIKGELFSALNRLNISKIDLLILTHTHFDHAENAADVKNKFGSTVLAHKSEAKFLALGDSPLPKGSIWPTKLVMGAFAKSLQPHYKYKPVTADISVEDKFDLSNWDFNAYILPTPGHTPGSLSIIIDNEIALVGDAMVGMFRGSVFSPFADDIPGMVKSWKPLLDTNASLFIPAHGTANSRNLLIEEYDKYKKKFLDK